MVECRAVKNWAHFYKIKQFKNESHEKMSTTTIVLLIQYPQNKINFTKIKTVFCILKTDNTQPKSC